MEYAKVKLTDEDRDVVLHPQLAGVMTQASRCIQKGATVFFRWTCQHCKARQGFDDPNTLHIKGECEECKGISDLLNPSADVGFMLLAGTPLDAIDALFSMNGDK